jgi:tripartite-type tricarboxylate transporter receptor subunit TctC
MSNIRSWIGALAIGALGVTGLAHPAAAQSYPSRNVTVLVAFSAGGLTDMIARLVATGLEHRLKHGFVAEYRGGAGGNIAARAVFSSAPDGYMLLATTTSLAVNITATKNKGFERSDLRPVAIVAISPDVIAVHPSNPAKTLKEFIANAKTKSFTYGSAGVGTGPYVGAEYFFKEVTKVKYVQVPFKGGAPAITAAIGNHVDSLVLTLPPVVPHIKSGALRGLGVAAPKRNPAIPNVPTYGEMGYPGIYSQSWVGFFAPAKTPDAVVEKLNTEINAVMKEPASVQTLAKAGFEPVVKSVAEASKYFDSEVVSWAKMVKAIGFSN